MRAEGNEQHRQREKEALEARMAQEDARGSAELARLDREREKWLAAVQLYVRSALQYSTSTNSPHVHVLFAAHRLLYSFSSASLEYAFNTQLITVL